MVNKRHSETHFQVIAVLEISGSYGLSIMQISTILTNVWHFLNTQNEIHGNFQEMSIITKSACEVISAPM